ncbi:MAG: transposase [Verrucomicrobiota bacterium]
MSFHSAGEGLDARRTPAQAALAAPLVVDTDGRRFHVEWDPESPVTPLGHLVFFSQFLGTAGLFHDWVKACPLVFASNNAPALNDLLGTITLAILAGQHRYSHVTALRADTVNPAGLGMSKVCSEDSVRRAFAGADPEACARWQTGALRQTWLPALRQPWIMDLDATVKPLYGHQEDAEIGYNPHKPGRPSHVYHSLFVRGLRLVLDVEVRPGKQTAAPHGRENLWRVWDSLPAACRPWLMCGDSSYGHEGLLAECEARQQPYLFRLRQSRGVKQLVQILERQSGWQPAVNGWAGAEGRLQLTGWTAKRRVVVLRRQQKRRTEPAATHELNWPLLTECDPAPAYEYQLLVTNLSEELLSIADLYRQRADAENVYDELKNQWGWGGFMTKDKLRCQVAARNVALIYNWWSLFVRCAEPERPREAVTSRPLLLCAVGRVIASGRQTTLRLTSTHAHAAHAQSLLTNLSLFLSGLKNTAEQLRPSQCWEQIWARILKPLLTPRTALPAPSG